MSSELNYQIQVDWDFQHLKISFEMKIVIRLVLVLLSLGLFYALYSTIKEPIIFRKEYSSRKEAVVEKLKDVRTAQKLYKTITDTFATNFKDLERVLTTGRFLIVQASGDRDAINAVISYDTLYIAAKDSIKTLRLNVADLHSIPFSDGKMFNIYASEIEQQGYMIPVVEVSSTYSEFMGEWAKPYFAKYDENYDPSNIVKFGSRIKSNLSGNWE